MNQNESNTDETQAKQNPVLTDLEAQDEVVGGNGVLGNGALLNVSGDNTPAANATVRGTSIPNGTVTFSIDRL